MVAENWGKILSGVVSVVLLTIFSFLLDSWLDRFSEDMSELGASMKELRISNEQLDDSVDSLRWQMGTTDGQIIIKLNDHEDRIRTLEKK